MIVLGFKLKNGEEIIGKVKQELAEVERMFETPEEVVINIESVRIIGLQETEQGIGLGLMPWTLGNPDAELVVKMDMIASVYSPKDNVVKTYMSQVSRIQLMS